MDVSILMSADKPIYEQIYEQIVAQILNGTMEPNYRLPPIRKIAKELGVSVITIKKAWEMLEQRGFIYTVVGRGCFVAENISHELEDKKIALAKEKLKKNLNYYRELGISVDKLCEYIRELY
ncbi:GntR family transcriptional regulator [Clostridiaceae bacterium M8S5]|nr:GntR family transcriptional regulator [Clostridiaceae bacterium M8S5]